MLTLTLKDWTGLVTSKTEMEESELGFDGNIERLQRFAQKVANDKTGSLIVEQDGKELVSANYLDAVV